MRGDGGGVLRERGRTTLTHRCKLVEQRLERIQKDERTDEDVTVVCCVE